MDDELAQKLKKCRSDLNTLKSLMNAKQEEIFNLITQSMSNFIDPTSDIYMKEEVRVMMKEQIESSKEAVNTLMKKLLAKHGDKS